MLKKLISAAALTALISTSAFASHHAPKHRISMEQAQKIATKAQEGTVESKKLEREHGKWIYSFDIRTNDKQVHKIHVDAKSGKVLSQNSESSQREDIAAEVAGEHNSLD